jgi:hypothetical protein
VREVKPRHRLYQVSCRAAPVKPGVAEVVPESVRPGIQPAPPAAAAIIW